MRHLMACVAALGLLGGLSTTSSAQTKLTGSGSTFIKPAMDKWIAEYAKDHPNVSINYQGTGSGAGIKQMLDKAVDFGCTDAYIKTPELKKIGEGKVIHVPLAMGAIVVAYNVEGIDKSKTLNFTGEVLADIYLGNVKKWNDEAIKSINPGIELPDLDIAVVHRSDSSGSTNIFTEFLTKHSEQWREKIKSGTTVRWPVGIGENQTAGVAGAVNKSAGSIGYVELFYAIQNGMKYGNVKNPAGQFIEPTLDSVSEAAKAKVEANKIGKDLRFSLIDSEGAMSYPLSGTTWAVVYTDQQEERGKALASFLHWILTEGQDSAKKMNYASLPPKLADLSKAAVTDSIGPK